MFDSKRLVFIFMGKDAGLEAMMGRLEKRSLSMGQKFEHVGKGMTKAFTLPIVAVGAVSTKMAVEFATSMKKVQTQAGGSAKDVATLSKEVLKLGLYAQQSPKELADSLFHLKSVGMDNVAAMKALRTSADLAAVGGAKLEDVTNALAGAWRSGIKQSGNFNHAAAILNATVGAGNMKMQELSDAMGTGFLSTATTFGVSLTSVGSALALMTDEGIPARVAATRLRMSMALLASPSLKARDILKDIGINSLDLAKKMRGPGGIVAGIQLLHDHLRKTGGTLTQQGDLLAQAFGGGRSGSAIMLMVNQLDVLKKKQEQINHTTSLYGKDVAAQRKTAAAQFALLKSSIEVTMVKIGDIILPVLVSLVTKIGVLATKFAELPGPVMKFIIAGLGILAVVGPILVITGKILYLIKVFQEFQIVSKLAFMTNPWFLLAAAIVVITVLIITHWKQVSKVLSAIWHSILAAAMVAWNWIKAHWPLLLIIVGGPMGALAVLMIKHWRGIASAGKVAFKVITIAAKIAWAAVILFAHLAWIVIGPIFKMYAASGKLAFHQVANAAKFAWSIIHPIFNFMATVAKFVFGVLKSDAKNAWRDASTAAKTAWAIIHPVFTVLGKVAHIIFDNIATGARKAWRVVSSAAKIAFNWVKTAIRVLWNVLVSVFGAIVHGAQKAFGWIPFLKGPLKAAGKAFDQFKDSVNKALNGVKNKKVLVNVGFSTGKGTGTAFWPQAKAAGGKIRGPGGPTDDKAGLFALSNDEYVVRASAHRKYGTKFMDAVNTGKLATGGSAGLNIKVNTPSEAKMLSMMQGAVGKLAVTWAKTLGAGGNAILATAMRYLHKVPYVWGGTTTGGWDCSGMTGNILKRFGFNPPRTAAQQQAWSQKAGNAPGNLVFFGRQAHHVGFSMGNGNMISALGHAYGTTISSLAGNSGFGVPPGGYGRVAGGSGFRGGSGVSRWSDVILQALNLLHQSSSWLGAVENRMGRESGGNPRIVNRSDSNWRAGHPSVGLMQLVEGTYRANSGRFSHTGPFSYGVSTDPLANTYAGLNYAIRRYGNLSVMTRPGGYKFGGPVSFDSGYGMLRPGMNLAYNGTGRNEHLAPAGSGTVINIYPKMLVSDKRALARELVDVLQEHKNKGGRLPA